MSARPSLWLSYGLFMFLWLANVACQIELLSSVPERHANMMIAYLNHQGIEASKYKTDKDGFYSLWIDEDKFSHSVEILTTHGYPRLERSNLAELFKPSGLVPTQFEEQVRYVYGLSEELAHTISLFDGVIDNRVHISLPMNEETEDKGKISAYVKYDQNIDFDNLVPQIKKLISDSVHGVSYHNVEILATPAYFPKYEQQLATAYEWPAGIRVLPQSYHLFLGLVAAIIVMIAQGFGLAFWFYRKWRLALADSSKGAGDIPPPDSPRQEALPQDTSPQDAPSLLEDKQSMSMKRDIANQPHTPKEEE